MSAALRREKVDPSDYGRHFKKKNIYNRWCLNTAVGPCTCRHGKDGRLFALVILRLHDGTAIPR